MKIKIRPDDVGTPGENEWTEMNGWLAELREDSPESPVDDRQRGPVDDRQGDQVDDHQRDQVDDHQRGPVDDRQAGPADDRQSRPRWMAARETSRQRDPVDGRQGRRPPERPGGWPSGRPGR